MKLMVKNDEYTYEQVVNDKKDMIEGLKLGISSFVPNNYDGDGRRMLNDNNFIGLVRMLGSYHPQITSIYFKYGNVSDEVRKNDEKVRSIAKEIFSLLDKVNNYESVDDIIKELDIFNELFKKSGVKASYKIEQ